MEGVYINNNRGQYHKGVENTELIKVPIPSEIIENHNFINYKDGMRKVCRTVFDKLKKDKRVLVIGGDHSSAYGTISAILKHQSDCKIIWFDAHPDINSFEESPSMNIHGMPLHLLSQNSLRLDKDVEDYLAYSQIIYIAIRDLDPYEERLIKEKNITYFAKEHVEQPDFFDSLKKAIGNHSVYMSIDVDGIDPTEFPCTGTPVPNGVKLDDLLKIIDTVKENPKWLGFEIMEINFDLGDDKEKEISMKSANSIIEQICK